jgi:hypothetical protein
MRILVFALFSMLCVSLNAQEEESIYDGLYIEQDSIKTPYKPSGKNYAFIRSKLGSNGVDKTAKADSILSLPVTDIVLVYTEDNPEDLAKREKLSRKRWENLNKTYPEFLAGQANLKSVCQCNTNGDTAAFKKMQGFYVYFPAKEEPKAEPKVEAKKESKEVVESGKKSKKTEEPVEEKPAKEEKSKKEKKVKEEKEVKVAKEEKPKKEEKSEEVSKKKGKEVEEPVAEVKPERPKREGYTKPKKSKNVAACRLPCYESGDEDLHAFFKDNIQLTKKQKRRSDDLVTILRLQLNFDGSIKKVMLQGANQDFNKQVEDAVKNMNLWNPAVKGGMTVKSEVKMTLKFDPETKAIKPFETMITPRLGPKCKCATDSELGLE